MWHWDRDRPLGLVLDWMMMNTYLQVCEPHNIVCDIFEPLGQYCCIITMNDPSTCSIKASHFKSIWSQFVCSENISCHICHHQRYCNWKQIFSSTEQKTLNDNVTYLTVIGKYSAIKKSLCTCSQARSRREVGIPAFLAFQTIAGSQSCCSSGWVGVLCHKEWQTIITIQVRPALPPEFPSLVKQRLHTKYRATSWWHCVYIYI